MFSHLVAHLLLVTSKPGSKQRRICLLKHTGTYIMIRHKSKQFNDHLRDNTVNMLFLYCPCINYKV